MNFDYFKGKGKDEVFENFYNEQLSTVEQAEEFSEIFSEKLAKDFSKLLNMNPYLAECGTKEDLETQREVLAEDVIAYFCLGKEVSSDLNKPASQLFATKSSSEIATLYGNAEACSVLASAYIERPSVFIDLSGGGLNSFLDYMIRQEQKTGLKAYAEMDLVETNQNYIDVNTRMQLNIINGIKDKRRSM